MRNLLLDSVLIVALYCAIRTRFEYIKEKYKNKILKQRSHDRQ